MPYFGDKLLKWHESVDRDLPWKKTKDPYRIWLSEIILQQTRVDQGLPYYLKFVELFPTVFDLAKADEDEVLLAWQGLGYYSRARNLQYSAKQIAHNHNGEFPSNYKDILGLKGVGPYTAAAIASFAFGLPYPVMDGNVVRVLSRYFGVYEAIDIASTRKTIEKLLDEVFLPQKAADFNQALMDFGALHCKPKLPKCDSCPFEPECKSLLDNMVHATPSKAKKLIKKKRHINYIWIQEENKVWIRKRGNTDIWKGLYDLPEIIYNAEDQKRSSLDLSSLKLVEKVRLEKHVLSHLNVFINIDVYEGRWDEGKNYNELKLVEFNNLNKFAFPIILRKFINEVTE